MCSTEKQTIQNLKHAHRGVMTSTKRPNLRYKKIRGALASACAALLVTCLGSCEPQPDDSAWAPPQGVFAVTTDYSTGSFSIVDPATLHAYNDVGVNRIHSDAVSRHFPSTPGKIYIVNRQGCDNIQILDTENRYRTIIQESTGTGSNPQDIAVIDDDRAYVTRYNRPGLWIIDPDTAAKTGEIDLSAYADSSSRGVPYMSRLYHYTEGGGSLVFVALQRLNKDMNPSDYSSVIVIQADSASPDCDTVIEEIRLQWGSESATNPYTAFRNVPDSWWQPPVADGHDHLFISCVGTFGHNFTLDCGIVAIDPVDYHCEEGYVISETTIGSEISDFVVKSGTRAYATTSDSAFASGLISFDPGSGSVTSVIRADSGNWGYLWSLALHSSGMLFVCDRNALDPGLRVYDTNDSDAPMNEDTPLYLGLPPFDLSFIE